MLKTLDIKKLTVFSEAHIKLSPHLNVIIGENGTGKTHLLKMVYAVLAASAEEGKVASDATPTKTALQVKIAEKIVGVLRPDTLGRLARRRQGRERCEISLGFHDSGLDIDFSFSTKSKSEVIIEKMPIHWLKKSPVFLPTRELLTLYPGFVSLYSERNLEFEETWRDTCLLLGAPTVKGPKEEKVRALLVLLEKAMDGAIELDKTGRFYLKTQDGRLEMPLVAEGLRKIAMLARLIATGSLLEHGYLLWDEPESNLNPALLKDVAKSILQVSQNGVQTWIATHSLFLMRELYILLQSEFTCLLYTSDAADE